MIYQTLQPLLHNLKWTKTETNQFPFKMTAPKATAFAMDTLSPIVGDLAIILAIPLAHQPSAVPFRAVLRDLEQQISSPLVGLAALCKSRYAPPWPMIKPWAVHGPFLCLDDPRE